MSTQKKIKTIDFEACGNNYTCKVEFEICYDPQYGADADGRRGEPMWDISGAEIIDDAVYNAETGKLVKKRGKMIEAALDKAIEAVDLDDLDVL